MFLKLFLLMHAIICFVFLHEKVALGKVLQKCLMCFKNGLCLLYKSVSEEVMSDLRNHRKLCGCTIGQGIFFLIVGITFHLVIMFWPVKDLNDIQMGKFAVRVIYRGFKFFEAQKSNQLNFDFMKVLFNVGYSPWRKSRLNGTTYREIKS